MKTAYFIPKHLDRNSLHDGSLVGNNHLMPRNQKKMLFLQIEMKLFLRHIILFFIAGAMIYMPLTWVVGNIGTVSNISYIPNNYGHMDLRLAEADSMCLGKGPDILFIGSSHCYRTFDTRMYDTANLKAFNLGSSNQTPKQSLALLERYLEHWTPRLVVIEVHPDIMENSGNESAVDILSNTHIDPPIRSMALSQKNLRVFNTLCFRLFDQTIHSAVIKGDSIINVSTNSGDTSLNVDFAYVRGGFVEVTPYCYKPVPIDPTTINARPDQLEALRQCLQSLKRCRIPCLLVEVPSTRARYESYTNHRSFEQQIMDIAASYAGTRYLNLNDDSRITVQLNDTTCFFDDDHLNQKGVAILNQFFLKCILSD